MTPKNRFDIVKAIKILRREVKKWKTPIVTKYSKTEPRPAFHVLISCLLSLRTKDKETASASRRLFDVADTPGKLAKLPAKKIEKLIYPVGFYRNKAKTIKDVCSILEKSHGGVTPDSIDELLKFKGVGRKTANLVVTLGFGKPGICVDTHVHRICNIWGYVKTRSPDETEFQLREILPKRYWIEFNDLLVTFGQNHCRPVSPFCSTCQIESICPRTGVKKSR